MDSRALIYTCLFLMSNSWLSLRCQAAIDRSVVFLECPSHKYVRSYKRDSSSESKSLSVDEVGAAVSVLLGFPPTSSLSADSSSKLNELLLPRLFNRPRAVFVLEVQGIKGLAISSSNSCTHDAYACMLTGSASTQINLPGDNNAFVVDIDEPLSVDCDAACLDDELANLAQLFGGAHVGSLQSPDGKLMVSLSDGTSLDLHLAKEADREFVLALLALIRKTKKAIVMHDDLAKNNDNPAVLIIGRFRGIQLLKEEYGSGEIVEKRIKLFQETLSKLLDSLQISYGGEIVSVILSRMETELGSKPLVEVKLSSLSSRLMEEVFPPNATAIAEAILVRRILAWITGIILVASTLIGICFLFKMPLTRDTLLYSNVKLD